MKKLNELRVGSILTYINIGISCVIPLLYTPIMLRILGQSEYGLYSLSNSVISYLTLLNLGMGTAVVRYVTKSRVSGTKEEVNGVVGLFLSIYTVLAIVVCVCGFILMYGSDTFFAQGLSGNELSKLKILLVIMTLSTAVSFPVSVFSSTTIAYEKYIFQKSFVCVSTILAPVFNLIVLFAGYATIGMALVSLFTQIITLILFVIYCRKKLGIYPVVRNMPTYMLKEVWGFSAFVFLSTLVDLLYWATDKVLIGGMLGTVAVAVYNIGGTFTTMLQNLASAVSGVFGTRVTAMVFEKRPMEEFSELLIRIGRIQYLIVSFVLSGYIVFGPAFLYFWAGEQYSGAYWIGLLTMIPLAVPLIQSIAFATIVAMNKHQFRAIVYACIAIVNLLSTIWAIPRYGIIGAAACTGISFVFGNGIVMNFYYHKVIKLDIWEFWKNIGKMSGVPLVLILLSVYIINSIIEISTLVMFAVGVGIYSIAFIALSWVFSMNNYEKKLISQLVSYIKR